MMMAQLLKTTLSHFEVVTKYKKKKEIVFLFTPSDLVKYVIFPRQFLKIPTKGHKFTLFATVMFENIWRFFNQTIFP